MRRRLIGIDFLRVLAAFIVFLYHTIIHLGCGYGVLMNFMRSGSTFMITFFVISGFCIYYNHDDTNLMQINHLKAYYIRRMIGILPLYYVVSVLYVIFIGKESVIENILLFPIEMLGLQTVYHTILDYTHNSGTWFISCLLICYLVYPLIQEIYKQISTKMKIIILGGYTHFNVQPFYCVEI